VPFGRKQIVQWLEFEAAAPPVTERPRSKLVFAPKLCLIRMARFGNKRSIALSMCIQFNFPFLRAHFQRCIIKTNTCSNTIYDCQTFFIIITIAPKKVPGKNFYMTCANTVFCARHPEQKKFTTF